MKPRHHVRILLAALLLFSADAAVAITCKERSLLLERTRIVFENLSWTGRDLGLSVYTGKGKKLLELGGVGKNDALDATTIEKAYFQPEMHPDQRRLIAVRCFQFPKDRDTIPRDARLRCDVVLIDLDTLKEDSLYSPPEGAWVNLPTWSETGERLAFFENQDIVIWSRAGLVRIPDAIDTAYRPFYSSDSATLAWETGGNRLLVYGGVPGNGNRLEIGWPSLDLGQVNPETRRVDWLGLREFAFDGKYSGFGAVFLPDLGWQLRPKKMPDTPATRALFGSAENPVFRPMWSPGREIYFYVTYNEGPFSSTWIEGYEVESGRLFHVRTLDRSLYSK